MIQIKTQAITTTFVTLCAALILPACANANTGAPQLEETAAKAKVKAALHGKEDTHSADGHDSDELALAPIDGHDEPRPYDETRDAWEDVERTTETAMEAGKSSIIVMGANWCHDSRGLAAHFEKPRFQTLLAEHYEYVYVDMGIRNRNLDIPASYGIDKVEGTPTIIILDPKGDVINLETAKTWRDAASRTEDAIFDEFEAYALHGSYTPPPKTEDAKAEEVEGETEDVKLDEAETVEVKPAPKPE